MKFGSTLICKRFTTIQLFYVVDNRIIFVFYINKIFKNNELAINRSQVEENSQFEANHEDSEKGQSGRKSAQSCAARRLK